MSVSNSVRIETLNRENYDTWKMQMEALLVKNDAWGYVSGEIVKPEAIDGNVAAANLVSEWSKNDNKAKSDLILSINPSELKQIKGCATSREVWLKLQGIYQSKGPARKATLLKQLTLSKMEDGEDVREHVGKMFDVIDKLNEMGVEIDPDLLSVMLLYSLPPTFENFRCAIESRDELPTPEVVRVKIIEESDARKNETRGVVQNAMMVKKSWNKNRITTENREPGKKGEFKFRCHRCGERGHMAVDCKVKKREHSRPSARNAEDVSLCAIENFLDSDVQEALRVENDTPAKNWCLDSGASSHICKEAHLFSEIYDLRRGRLNLASNSSTEIIAKGTVLLSANVNGRKKNVSLSNVLQVPDLRTNLMSVAKITDKNCDVLFTKGHATVIGNDGEVILYADRVGDLYFVREEYEQECKAIAEESNRSSKPLTQLEMWHRRMGHLNVQDLQNGDRKKSLLGMNLGKYEKNLECNICLLGKMVRTSFPKKSERKTGLLEIIHSDLCGPMRVESNNKAKYYVTFIDDNSRWSEVRFLRKKSEAFEAFKEFKALVENQKERKIKFLQCDNGTEYLSNDFDDFLKKSGIQRRLTVPYNPEQNGTAERKNRTLMEMARCLLIQSGLPPSFWAEAVSTANFIRNRCPTKSLDGQTPYEVWNGRAPNVGFFKEFGSHVIILDRTPGKWKIEERGKKGIFLGYDDKSKGFRIWIPEEKIVQVTRDVAFLKNSKNPTNGIYEEFIPEELDSPELNVGISKSERKEVEVAIQSLNQNWIPAQGIYEEDEPDPDENIEEDGNEEITEAEVEDIEVPLRRGPGRPAKILTGLRGRPRKRYCPYQKHVDQNENLEEAHLEEVPTKQAVSGPDAEEWYRAMADEVKSIIKNDAWELVERPNDREVIGSRMVLRNKYKPDGKLERREARIVARGFAQRPGVHFNQTFAPVARLGSIRLLVALAAEYGMSIRQFDVTTAYLNGVIEEEVFMETPNFLAEALENIIQTERNSSKIGIRAKRMQKDLESGDKVCLLKKSLYGLRQTGRSWHVKLDGVLKRLGATPSNADPCVYYLGQEEEILIIAIYVDDILVASRNLKKIAKFKEEILKEFDIRDLGEPKYCLGIEFSRDGNTIAMNQKGYIKELLDRFGMAECKPVTTPFDINVRLTKREEDSTTAEKKLPYRELVGCSIL